MLLAEIHGKRCIEVQGQEDLLTSAVFGHLRQIPPSIFWPELFERAMSTSVPPASLSALLKSEGVSLANFDSLQVVFWRDCGKYGEPDIILRFTGDRIEPLIVLVEVKLDSEKSGTGDHDQLAKYLALLNDRDCLKEWSAQTDRRFLVYLTRAFAETEIQESVLAYGDSSASTKMFGLEWRDVLEVSSIASTDGSEHSTLLSELAKFLKLRGFEAFHGFKCGLSGSDRPEGTFYGAGFFQSIDPQMDGYEHGRFYGD